MTLQLLQEQDGVQIQLLSPAGVPAAPSTPGRQLFILFGIVAGIVFGISGALIQEAVRGADR